MKSAIQKAAAALGRIKSDSKAIAARQNGFLCKPRTQAEIDAHNADVMRQAIGRSSTRDVYRRGTAHLRDEMPNDFSNKQKGK